MYEYETRVGFSQCGASRLISIPAILDNLQDASTFQSEDLGVGFSRLEPDNLLWVVSYWDLSIIRFPNYCERIKVGTFPYAFKTCMGSRNFYIKDMEGNYLVKADSLWTLLNTTKMFPAKPPQDLLDTYVLDEKLDMEYHGRKVIVPEGAKLLGESELAVGSHHLDGNGHVNNGQYVKVAVAALEDTLGAESAEFLNSVSNLRIDYRKQARLGDTFYIKVYEADSKDYFISIEDNDSKPISVVELR